MRPVILAAASLLILSCEEQELSSHQTDTVTPSSELSSKLARSDKVTFESWNGKLRGADSDSLLHFRADSRVVLEERSIGVRTFEGTFEVEPTGRVSIELPEFDGPWPVMALRRDGDDLVLHREDGHTSWLPPDYPDPPASVDGFWPFREAK